MRLVLECRAYRFPVDVLFAEGLQDDVSLASHRHLSADVVADAFAQRDEGCHLARDGLPRIAVPFEGEGPRDAASDSHRDDKATSSSELVENLHRDVPGAHSELDPVEGTLARQADRTVAQCD